MKILMCDVQSPMNNAAAYTYFDDITPTGPFLHIHIHVLHVPKPLYWFRLWLGVIRHQAINWNSVDQDQLCITVALRGSGLTHLPLDKMAAILADDIFKCIYLNENDRIPIQISLNFVPDDPIDNNRALV